MDLSQEGLLEDRGRQSRLSNEWLSVALYDELTVVRSNLHIDLRASDLQSISYFLGPIRASRSMPVTPGGSHPNVNTPIRHLQEAGPQALRGSGIIAFIPFGVYLL